MDTGCKGWQGDKRAAQGGKAEGVYLEVSIGHEAQAVAVGAEGFSHGCDEGDAAPEARHPEVLRHLPSRILHQTACLQYEQIDCHPLLMLSGLYTEDSFTCIKWEQLCCDDARLSTQDWNCSL